jgi:LacI family transcriptional regulator
MPPCNRVTLSEIAEQSGVSLSTASLALRDKPGVGTATRQRVLGVARELGYLPKNGVQYRLGLTNIGLIFKSEPGYTPQTNQFYSHVLAGIEAACRQWQVNLLYATLPVDRDSYPLEFPRVLLEEDTADGLLLIGAFLDDTIAWVVERRSTPIVLVDACAASDLYDAVVSDSFKGARYAVTYLTRRGHRHIGFVGSPLHAYSSIRERHRGYAQALQDNEIPDSYFADCHIIDREGVLDATADLLRQNPQVTALFAANDEVAIAAMEAVQALGRRIPDDISIIGFNDIDPSKSTLPPLTTMHVDKVGMGMLAVQLLINRVEYPGSSPVTAAIHPHLVERQSVQSI